MQRVWVGLGGNVGDVPAALRSALAALSAAPGVTLAGCSRLYSSPPWGVTDQPAFVNAVAELTSALEPLALLDLLHAVERAHGRRREAETRWGPRTLDLDLLAVDDVVLDHPRLSLPHPRIAERAFVLVPWAELAPTFEVPRAGRVDELCVALDCSGIEAIP